MYGDRSKTWQPWLWCQSCITSNPLHNLASYLLKCECVSGAGLTLAGLIPHHVLFITMVHPYPSTPRKTKEYIVTIAIAGCSWACMGRLETNCPLRSLVDHFWHEELGQWNRWFCDLASDREGKHTNPKPKLTCKTTCSFVPFPLRFLFLHWGKDLIVYIVVWNSSWKVQFQPAW